MSYNVPDWYLDDGSIPTSRRLTAVNSFNVDPFSVEELTWKNGQLLVNEIGHGLTRPGSEAVVGTLESIVDLATQKQPLSLTKGDSEDIDVPWLDFRHVSSSGGSSAASMTDALVPCAPTEEEQHQRIHNVAPPSQRINACFEDGTTRESRHFSSVDTCEKDSGRGFGVETASLWSQGLSSSEMPDNYTNNSTMHDDSFCLTRPQGEASDKEGKKKKGAVARSSLSTKRSRAAAIHNQTERKRRDMINQKMKTLQKLVPNSSKTDKSSMLDEVIEYLKQLQSQVHMMNMSRMSMMMPFTMPQHPYNMPMNMMHPLNMINSIMAHQNLANLSPLVNPSAAFMPMVATDRTAFDPSAYLASCQSQLVSIEAYAKMIALIQQQQQQQQLASNKN